MEFRSRWSLPLGMAVVMLSAMMLNGFIGYMIWPEEYVEDSFVGGASHLLLGLVPFLAGIALLAVSSVAPRKMARIVAGGLAGGVVMSAFLMSVVIREPKLKAAVLWFTIMSFGLLAGIFAHVLVASQNASPAQPLHSTDAAGRSDDRIDG